MSSSAGQGVSHIQDPSLPQGETRLVCFANQSYGETEPGRLEAGARLFCSRDPPGHQGASESVMTGMTTGTMERVWKQEHLLRAMSLFRKKVCLTNTEKKERGRGRK